MIVRPFEPRDAAELGQVFRRSVQTVGSAHYGRAQVEAWAAAEPSSEAYLRRGRDGRVFLVAVDLQDRPLAYGDLEPDGHVDHLYCSPEFTRTGLATALYEKLEQAAVGRGLELLYTDASEPARSFFLKRGFKTLQRRELILGDAPIHHYRMEKPLRSR